MNKPPPIKKLLRTAIAFTVTALLCTVLIIITVINRENYEELTMQQVILEKGNKANETLSRLLYKTQTISIFAQKGYTRQDFVQIASTVMDDPAIQNILIAPDGVVTDVYPLEDNEAVVGLDFFSEGAGNKEAVLAKETKQLVLGGPFDAVQGGQVIVGRLPVFTPLPDGGEEFWGLVSVTLKYPDVLAGAGFDELYLQGFEYEVWRINPDSGKKQIITGSGYSNTGRVHYVEKSVPIQNAEWFFRIYPIDAWYEHPDLWLMTFIGLFISALVAFVFQNNIELETLKLNYEELARLDSLTGIANRRYFMEAVTLQLERSARLKTGAAVLMLDIDLFKSVNDTHGHLAGDKVLQDLTAVVKRILRPYDLFGRYGGEEFIILAVDISESDAVSLAERIRSSVESTPVLFGEKKIPVTVSIGVAYVGSMSDFQRVTDRADRALYEAKGTGRNRVVIWKAK